MNDSYEVIIIGAGQAGLALGYYLKIAAIPFLMLEAAPEPGYAWRRRWDSLVAFTPAAYSALPGLPFPKDPRKAPTKDEIADYLALYAYTFDLPIQYNARVTRLSRVRTGYHIQTGSTAFIARNVVIATGPYHVPMIPDFAARLDPGVFQVHTSAYRNPSQIPGSSVLVVGGGNSGAQIARELTGTHTVTLSQGRPLPYMPGWLVTRTGYYLLDTFGFMRVNIESRLGKRISRSDAVYGVDLRQMARRGLLTLKPRVIDAHGGRVIFDNGESMQVSAVIWATGFNPDYHWIDVPIFDASGRPIHRRGVTNSFGLYFLGLEWQWTRGSALIGWVGRDAAFIASRIARDRILNKDATH